MEKSREATDLANIRSAYAEVTTLALSDPDQDHSATVSKKQAVADWQNAADIAGITIAGNGSKEINSTTATEVKYDHSTQKITIDSKETSGDYTAQ